MLQRMETLYVIRPQIFFKMELAEIENRLIRFKDNFLTANIESYNQLKTYHFSSFLTLFGKAEVPITFDQNYYSEFITNIINSLIIQKSESKTSSFSLFLPDSVLDYDYGKLMIRDQDEYWKYRKNQDDILFKEIGLFRNLKDTQRLFKDISSIEIFNKQDPKYESKEDAFMYFGGIDKPNWYKIHKIIIKHYFLQDGWLTASHRGAIKFIKQIPNSNYWFIVGFDKQEMNRETRRHSPNFPSTYKLQISEVDYDSETEKLKVKKVLFDGDFLNPALASGYPISSHKAILSELYASEEGHPSRAYILKEENNLFGLETNKDYEDDIKSYAMYKTQYLLLSTQPYLKFLEKLFI